MNRYIRIGDLQIKWDDDTGDATLEIGGIVIEMDCDLFVRFLEIANMLAASKLLSD